MDVICGEREFKVSIWMGILGEEVFIWWGCFWFWVIKLFRFFCVIIFGWFF